MTEPSNIKPWLRLAYDSANIAEHPYYIEKDERQLKLPLPEPDFVFVIDVEDFRLSSFRRALNHLKPKWVFDIRAAPRLDRLAGGRAHAFREFDRLGAQYIDIFGIIGLSNYKNAAANPYFWTPVIEEFLRSSKTPSGPYLALLDDDLMINTVSKFFASSISHVTGRDIALSRFRDDTAFADE